MEEINPTTERKCSKITNFLAVSLISTLIVSTISSILLFFPIVLISGAIRAFGALKTTNNGGKSIKSPSEEDSGIDGDTEESDDDDDDKSMAPKMEKFPELAADKKLAKIPEEPENFEEFLETPSEPPFAVQKLSSHVSLLKISKNLGETLAEYMTSAQKRLFLVTFRDVATLTNHASSHENTARIAIKRRKLKVMELPEIAEKLTETLTEILEKTPTSLTWIYVLAEPISAQEMCENRRISTEIRRMVAEFGHNKTEWENVAADEFEMEFLILKNGEHALWFNCEM
ncbi:unnamed protein product [Caenorhabditis sp. 36 PRJEB53466]|nr:unnamed protein product [Caenorhabditis sp. 36 PRJEB53466]